MKKLSLGISPCPNDTFMFDALINHKIDTEGLDFDVTLLDVEELNNRANLQEFDISKLSFHAMAYLLNDYQLLKSGSALGKGVGPILIARNHLSEEEIDHALIGIPGKLTTANFLLSIAYPRATDKKEYVFSDIEDALLRGDIDAGLIIHENRFTYEKKGLVKLIDLGNYWEQRSGGIIPLGGIVAKRSLDQETKNKVERLIRKSIIYAFENATEKTEFVRNNAQELDEDVIKKHIDLYVNQYSLDLGEEGEMAVEKMFQLAKEKELINQIVKPIFV